ncbi:ParA family protein [Trichocoleus sp. FACHB-262]|uniref:ParA family protein n=1 Tax=Trichocoleus sp. FACHB-262 TaxID=2692869 RepID=UPI001682FB95|nr:ParA family protein [Trichocoleus sp. FACHB-262]MBD2124765.1 ParA family protein [Trichocoleus sp. FACHB-262]
MRTIAVAARKGGVGKSTIACGLASVLANQGNRVLVVDLDPQSNAGFVLGVNPTAPGSAELLKGNSPVPLQSTEMLHVLPGGPELSSRHIQSLHPEDLAEVLLPLDYDIALIDCPPGDEHLERLGLVASTVALAVTDSHPLAIIGAGRVLAELETYQAKKRKGPSRWAIVMSRIDLRRVLDKELEDLLDQAHPSTPRMMVHQDTNLSLAAADRVPLMQYAPTCKGAKDLMAIADWIKDA